MLGGGKQDQQPGDGGAERIAGPGWGQGAHTVKKDGPLGSQGAVSPQETQGWAAPSSLSLADSPRVPALPHTPPFLLGPLLGHQLPGGLSHPSPPTPSQHRHPGGSCRQLWEGREGLSPVWGGHGTPAGAGVTGAGPVAWSQRPKSTRALALDPGLPP